MKELLLEIWTSISRNKLRTFLTGFSVAWGIFMLVILLGAGNGLKNAAMSNFGNMAINTVNMFGGSTSVPYMGYDKDRRIQLTNNDLEILKNEFPEIDKIAATIWTNGSRMVYGKEFLSSAFMGVSPDVASMQGIEIVEGRFINEIDMVQQRKVLVVDKTVKEVLFKNESPLGKRIKLDSIATSYTIVGVYKASQSFGNTSVCYLPLTTSQLIYTANNPYLGRAMFTVNGVETDEQMTAFENRIRTRLAKEHYFSPDDNRAIFMYNHMEEYKSMMLVFGGVSIFVWIIGLGTLLAGVVGVSNIMLVTVRERTFEFGIRKALGARPSSIIRLILTESVMVTALFGYIGMVMGIGVMEIADYVISNAPPATDDNMNIQMFVNPTINLSIALSATVVLVIAGLIAGYMPAKRAARLKTIDAMRYNK